MMTLVIDFHGKVAHFDLVDPFFYPLRAKGQIELFLREKEEGRRYDPLKTMEKVRLFLTRRRIREWQVIFLLEISEEVSVNPAETNDLCVPSGCLSEQLARIRARFLQPLRECRKAPGRAFAIVVDGLSRDPQTWAPLDLEHRLRWEIDCRGFLSEAFDRAPCCFHSTQVREMNEKWRVQVDLKGERIDQGLSGLSRGVREEIQAQCSEVADYVDKLVKRMTDAIQTLTPSPAHFLTPEILGRVRRDFLDRLSQSQKQVSVFENFRPGESIFKEILRQTFSAPRVNDGSFLCIRLEAGRSDLEGDGSQLLRLAYLMIFICENGQMLDRGRREEAFWRLKKLDIDSDGLRRLLLSYERRLQPILEKTRDGIRSRACEVETFEQNEGGCACVDGIQHEAIPEVSTIRNNDEWDAWTRKVLHGLDKSVNEAQEQVAACRDALTIRSPLRERELAPDLDKRISELEAQYKVQKQDLAGKSYQKIEHAWTQAARGIGREIIDLLICLPTLVRTLAVAVLASAVFLTPQILVVKPEASIAERLTFPVILSFSIMVSACLLSAWIALYRLRRRLKTLLEEAGAEALTQLERIEAAFEGNLSWIMSLCRLKGVAGNLRSAKRARDEARIRRARMQYHESALQHRMQWAAHLMEYWGCPVEAREEYRELRSARLELAYDLPEFLNEDYAPAAQPNGWQTFDARIGDMAQNMASRFLPGLREIAFEREELFERGL